MDVLSFSNGRDVKRISNMNVAIEYLDFVGTPNLTIRLMIRKFKAMIRVIQFLPDTCILDIQIGEKHWTPHEFLTKALPIKDGFPLKKIVVLSDVEYVMFYHIKLNNTLISPALQPIDTYIRESILKHYTDECYFRMADSMKELALYNEYPDMTKTLTLVENTPLRKEYTHIVMINALLYSDVVIPYSKIEIEINKLGNPNLFTFRRRIYMRSEILPIVNEIESELSQKLSIYAKQFLKAHYLFPKY
jgi:hypothetical protein